MLSFIKEWVFILAPYALLLPLLTGLIRFRVLPLPLRIVLLHVGFAAATEGAANLLWYYKANNLFLLHIYTVEESGLLLWYFSLLFKGFMNRAVFGCLFGAVLCFAIVNAVYWQPLTANNTYVRSLEAIIMILCCLLYYYRSLGQTDGPLPAQSPYFWINTGLLLYFAASLLLFTLSNYIIGPQYKQLRNDVWALHAFFSILLYLFITIGLWKQRAR